MAAYIDTKDPETLKDFCMPIEGFEAPYGKAQMVLYNDSAVTPRLPRRRRNFSNTARSIRAR